MKAQQSLKERMKQDIIAFEQLEDNAGNSEVGRARVRKEAKLLHARYDAYIPTVDEVDEEGDAEITMLKGMIRRLIEKHITPRANETWTESLEQESNEWRKSIPHESDDWKRSLEPEDTSEDWKQSLELEEPNEDWRRSL